MTFKGAVGVTICLPRCVAKVCAVARAVRASMGAAVAASVDASHATMTIVINRDMRISVCVLTVSGAPGMMATGALYATNVQKNSKPTAVAPIFFLIFSPVSAVTFLFPPSHSRFSRSSMVAAAGNSAPSPSAAAGVEAPYALMLSTLAAAVVMSAGS